VRRIDKDLATPLGQERHDKLSLWVVKVTRNVRSVKRRETKGYHDDDKRARRVADSFLYLFANKQ
jgi:hypothetical protein